MSQRRVIFPMVMFWAWGSCRFFWLTHIGAWLWSGLLRLSARGLGENLTLLSAGHQGRACLRSRQKQLVFGQKQHLTECNISFRHHQKETFQGYCNVHPAATAELSWGLLGTHSCFSLSSHSLPSPGSVPRGKRAQSTHGTGMADCLAAWLWLHGKEDIQQSCSQQNHRWDLPVSQRNLFRNIPGSIQ